MFKFLSIDARAWVAFCVIVAVGLYAIDAQSCEVAQPLIDHTAQVEVAFDASYRASVETECDDHLVDDATNDVYKFVDYSNGLCNYVLVDFD